MFIVVDANRLYSALLTKGDIFRVFELNAIFKQFEFIAPDFIFFEIGKNFDDIVKRSKLSKEELSEVFSFIKEQVQTIPFSEFSDKLKKAKYLAPHEKDAQYFALALLLNCPIWSFENAFSNQSEVEIISTKRLLELLSEI